VPSDTGTTAVGGVFATVETTEAGGGLTVGVIPVDPPIVGGVALTVLAPPVVEGPVGTGAVGVGTGGVGVTPVIAVDCCCGDTVLATTVGVGMALAVPGQVTAFKQLPAFAQKRIPA